MKRITVDDQLRAKLHGLSGRIHLCDEDGFLLSVIEPNEQTGAASSLVTWDEELSQTLGNVGAGVEFLDNSGAIIAQIPPATGPVIPHPLTQQQLQDFKHRQSLEGCITTEELLRRLRSE